MCMQGGGSEWYHGVLKMVYRGGDWGCRDVPAWSRWDLVGPPNTVFVAMLVVASKAQHH
jgi:hypothetical protein